MLAQRIADQLVGEHGIDGLLQRARQVGDTLRFAGSFVHREDVLGDLGGRSHALLDAVQPSRETDRQRQIGVAGRVGAAQFDARSLTAGGGNANERGAVAGRPCEIAGRLIAGHEPLVGIDQRVGDGGHGAHMVQQTGDEGVGFLRESQRVARVGKHVFAILEQRHIGVHAAAVDAEHRLGHEGGVQAVLLRQRLDGQLEGHDVVGGGQRVGVLEIDLVLSSRDLVMGGLDFKAHLLKRHADFAAGALAVIERAQVKIAGFVARLGGRAPRIVGLEEEKLALGADVEGIAQLGRARQRALERAAGIADERRAVGVIDVADQSRDATMLRPPRQNRVGIQIGVQILIGFMNADEALDGAAVDHDLVIHRLFNLRSGDGHVLQLSEDVRKLHTDELHVLIFYHAQDVFLAVLSHETALPNSI